ncbi:MAG: copper resistance system multicopper oxidase [Tistlia sp.]|uniref:copper resistance system multicopper oxidase n=1 Tax=Tistlia sp. TaxID=3057121 RepID=UPI0034A4B725
MSGASGRGALGRPRRVGRGLCLAPLFAAVLGVLAPLPAGAAEYDLAIEPVTVERDGATRTVIGYNGQSPGPTLRFREGEEVTIRVTNRLQVSSSIHWHGIILPSGMDGVPGLSFDGIEPGETFTYRFPVTQSGTYWFHSHSEQQEQDGAYGSIVIEPEGREPFRYDRDYVVLLSDEHDHAGATILNNLKTMPDYYNRQQRTVGDFFADVSDRGLGATLAERAAWGEMRMMPTDITDVQDYRYLINGRDPGQNWTALFDAGERIRLRFINASAMTYFDLRIPGLQMTVVQADGNNVQPVPVDELRIAVSETFDVIVRPTEARAYTLFAETMARDGYARATLAPREGMTAEVPELREPPLLTMADMRLAHGDMGHGDMGHGETGEAGMGEADTGEADMGEAGMDHSTMTGEAAEGGMAGMDHAQMGHGAATGAAADPFYAPGSGLTPSAAGGGRFLSYADLKAQRPLYAERPAGREIEIRLTGNMERYIWSINGIKYEDAEPIRLQYGERVRFKFVNETMMTHPMHLHGMWSILDAGSGKWNPVKHVVSVAPGTTVYTETEVDAPGRWAFHCHLLYHMASGMFREVRVEGGPQSAALPTSPARGE